MMMTGAIYRKKYIYYIPQLFYDIKFKSIFIANCVHT